MPTDHPPSDEPAQLDFAALSERYAQTYAAQKMVPLLEENRKLHGECEALREALSSIAAVAVGEGDVCELIARRARAALAARTKDHP